jgi:hypothetical protein
MNHLGHCSVLSSRSLRPNAVAGRGEPAYKDCIAGRGEPAYKDCIAGHGGPAYRKDQNCWTMDARRAGRAPMLSGSPELRSGPRKGCPYHGALPDQSNRLLFYSSIRRSTDAATRGQ